MNNKQCTGTEPFTFNDKELPFTILNFWQWGFSDLLNNTLRGILAEFIVAQALNAKEKLKYRNTWAPYDLELRNGITIEVKSGSFVQSWHQDKLSNISFSIKPASYPTHTSKRKIRVADIYIFCVYKIKTKKRRHILNLNNWEFYVISKRKLTRLFSKQKTVTLNTLKSFIKPIRYDQLKKYISNLIKKEKLI